LLTDPAAAGERAVRSRIKLDKLDWSVQKETLVETVEALAGPGKLHSRRKVGTANISRAGRIHRWVVAKQKDKEIKKHV